MPIVNPIQAYNNLNDEIIRFIGSRPSLIEVEEFPYKLYSFIIKSIRKRDSNFDAHGRKLLERLLLGCQEIWIEVNRKVDTLDTLFDPENIDLEYLDSLRKLVGFTDEYLDVLSLATETELRRIVARATLFWFHRYLDPGVVTAVRLVTGNRFKVRDWFDFRYVSGETLITEDLENNDPSVLSRVTLDSFQTATNGITRYNGVNTFYSDSLPPDQEHVGAYIVIYDDSGSPSNNGFYEIIGYNAPGKYFITATAFPRGVPSMTWFLAFQNNEFLTEVRVVDEFTALDGAVNLATPTYFSSASTTFGDDDVGEYLRILLSSNGYADSYLINTVVDANTVELIGADFTVTETSIKFGYGNNSVNRNLLEGLIEIQRANSERVNVVYTDFMDLFQTTGDMGQWEDIGGDAYTASVESGYLSLVSSGGLVGGIETSRPNAADWTNYEWKSKIAMKSNGSFRLPFCITDVDNYYFLKVTYTGFGTGAVRLWRRVATVETAISGSIIFPSLNLDTYWTYTIETYYNPVTTNTEINVLVDNSYFFNGITDNNFSTGNIGYISEATCEINVAETEMWQYPLTINRVGPNP
ncbi:MAG: hypothetical protein KAS32_19770 [Candidatus Peribacteraceae bacterium]|nr:hypothetical protein [Candidatus Peribacteraceae bacterium]